MTTDFVSLLAAERDRLTRAINALTEGTTLVKRRGRPPGSVNKGPRKGGGRWPGRPIPETAPIADPNTSNAHVAEAAAAPAPAAPAMTTREAKNEKLRSAWTPERKAEQGRRMKARMAKKKRDQKKAAKQASASNVPTGQESSAPAPLTN